MTAEVSMTEHHEKGAQFPMLESYQRNLATIEDFIQEEREKAIVADAPPSDIVNKYDELSPQAKLLCAVLLEHTTIPEVTELITFELDLELEFKSNESRPIPFIILGVHSATNDEGKSPSDFVPFIPEISKTKPPQEIAQIVQFAETNKRKLEETLKEKIANNDNFEELCFALGVESDSFSGNFSDRIAQLIAWVKRHQIAQERLTLPQLETFLAAKNKADLPFVNELWIMRDKLLRKYPNPATIISYLTKKVTEANGLTDDLKDDILQRTDLGDKIIAYADIGKTVRRLLLALQQRNCLWILDQ